MKSAVVLFALVLITVSAVINQKIALIALFLFILFLISYYFPEIIFPILLIPTKFTTMSKKLNLTFNPMFLIFALVLLSILIKIYKSHKSYRIPAKLFFLYGGLSFWMFLSLIWTQDQIYGRDKFFEFITLTSLSCFAPFFLFQDRFTINRFLSALSFIGTFFAIALFIFYDPVFIQFFKSIIYISPNILAPRSFFGFNYLAIQETIGYGTLIICYYFLLKDSSKKQKLLLISLMTLLIAALPYAGGKASIFYLIITITFIMIFNLKFRIYKLISALSLFTIFLSIFTTFIVLKITNFAIRIQFFLTPGSYASVERIENAKIALSLFHRHPLIGIGIGGFRKYSYMLPEIERFKYPHNIFLETLSELGLIGFIFFILILIFAIKQFFNLLKKYGNSKVLYLPLVIFSLFIFSLMISQSSGNINNHSLFAWVGTLYVIEEILSKTDPS